MSGYKLKKKTDLRERNPLKEKNKLRNQLCNEKIQKKKNIRSIVKKNVLCRLFEIILPHTVTIKWLIPSS